MHERRFNPSKMAKLDNPERRKSLPPEQLLQALPIQDNDTVLDLGAGTGYFALSVAKRTKGTVYALDVEPQMLSVLKERADQEGLDNIRLVQGVIEDIPFDSESVNHVIASLVLHEVEPLSKGLQEIYRTLKKDGHCFCLEWEKKESLQGPPLHHRILSNDMKKEMDEAGFELVSESAPTDAHYLLIVKKKAR